MINLAWMSTYTYASLLIGRITSCGIAGSNYMYTCDFDNSFQLLSV